MQKHAHISGSILPSTPSQLAIGPFTIKPSADLDTHFLLLTHEEGTSIMAEHGNGHSLRNLAERFMTRDETRIKAQWQYIQDCGGMCRPWSVFEYHLTQQNAA